MARVIVFIVVSFRDEERHLPTMLESLVGQTRRPDRLFLVDDGSVDASPRLADEFAARHEWARALHRPVRPREVDRLASAPEWRSFLWALEQIDEPFDAIAKMDADIRLTPETLATIEGAFEADPRVGMAGAYLSARDRHGNMRRERNPWFHVRGPTKFYRRECLEQILPVPTVPGWESIDERKARMHGWRTVSLEIPSGDPEHMRPMGTLDGALRGFRRDGRCSQAYGAHPLHVLLGAVNRMRDWPYLLGGLNYLAGFVIASLRRAPRADAEVRRFARREQMAQLRARLVRRANA